MLSGRIEGVSRHFSMVGAGTAIGVTPNARYVRARGVWAVSEDVAGRAFNSLMGAVLDREFCFWVAFGATEPGKLGVTITAGVCSVRAVRRALVVIEVTGHTVIAAKLLRAVLVILQTGCQHAEQREHTANQKLRHGSGLQATVVSK